MIRNLKALGLALIAVFAMSAFAASAASATDFFTTSNGEPAYLTGVSEDNKFEITGTGTKFECTTSKFLGTAVHGASTATFEATYTGKINETPHNTVHQCTSTLGSVTIDMNGCHYVLTGNTTAGDAKVWIQCGAEPIKITGALGCTISVPSQTPSGGVIYDNLPNHSGGAAVKATVTVTSITYTTTAACGFVGLPAHGADADYTGTVTVTGFTDKSTNPTTLTTPVTEGAQVGISVS